MAEPQSTMDRLHAAAEQRQRNAGKVYLGPPERSTPTSVERTEVERRAAARDLPDSLFVGDQEVRRLSVVLASRTSTRDNWRSLQRWLSGEAHRLATEIEQAEKDQVWSVLADAAVQDEGFSCGLGAIADMGEKRALVAAVTAALELLGSEIQLNEAVRQVREARQARLFQLKLAHNDAHGEEQQ